MRLQPVLISHLLRLRPSRSLVQRQVLTLPMRYKRDDLSILTSSICWRIPKALSQKPMRLLRMVLTRSSWRYRVEKQRLAIMSASWQTNMLLKSKNLRPMLWHGSKKLSSGVSKIQRPLPHSLPLWRVHLLLHRY